MIRTAALSSLISRLPNDSVVKIELFIQGFRAFLPWGLSQESKASFRRERSDRQTEKTKSNPASFRPYFSTLALGFELEFLCYGRLLTLNIAVSDLTWA